MDSPDPGHKREEALACRVPRKGNLCRWDRGHCSSMSVVAFVGLLWLRWWMHIWFSFSIRLFTNLRGHNQCWETCPKVIKQTHGRWAEQPELVYSCKASGLGTVYNYEGTSMKIDIPPCKLRTYLWIYEYWKTFSQMRGFQLHLSSAQRIGSGHSGIGKKISSRQAWIEWQCW